MARIDANKGSMPADIAILTVSYNSSAQVRDFLAHALPTVASPSQIFVVDNASEDAQITAALCAAVGANHIVLPENIGYGGALNAGVAAAASLSASSSSANSSAAVSASPAILLLCNPDLALNNAAVTALRERVLSEDNLGVVGPAIMNEDGTTYPSGREIPSIGTGIGHALFSNIWPGNPWTARYHAEAYRQGKPAQVGWVSGACIAIRTEHFDAVGGFDDAYFMYFEDVDLAYRLLQQGKHNFYEPAAQVTHIGGESTKARKKEMVRVHHKSAMRFIKTRYPGVLWAPVRGVVGLGLSIRERWQTRGAN